MNCQTVHEQKSFRLHTCTWREKKEMTWIKHEQQADRWKVVSKDTHSHYMHGALYAASSVVLQTTTTCTTPLSTSHTTTSSVILDTSCRGWHERLRWGRVCHRSQRERMMPMMTNNTDTECRRQLREREVSEHSDRQTWLCCSRRLNTAQNTPSTLTHTPTLTHMPNEQSCYITLHNPQQTTYNTSFRSKIKKQDPLSFFCKPFSSIIKTKHKKENKVNKQHLAFTIFQITTKNIICATQQNHTIRSERLWSSDYYLVSTPLQK